MLWVLLRKRTTATRSPLCYEWSCRYRLGGWFHGPSILMARPTRSNVVFERLLCPLVCVLAAGCAKDERLPNYQFGAVEGSPSGHAPCSTPADGCPCDTPGELVDCGEVVEQHGDTVTCSEGVRLCGDSGSWGACVGDTVRTALFPNNGKAALAFGEAESCTAANPCDPLCRQFVDTGVGVTGLKDGLCSTAAGISLCPLCGYSGPVASVSFEFFPPEWQVSPAVCTPGSNDGCPLDMVCVGATCQSRAAPCASTDPACDFDLTLGKPCFDASNANSSYHVPLCNRGATELKSGTIVIGVDSRKENVLRCVPHMGSSDGEPAFPDSGSIRFVLSGGRTILAGACVDVNSSNSQATALDLMGNRAFVVNYDGAVSECKPCNNGSIAIMTSDLEVVSTCTECSNLECFQTNSQTTLRGVLHDPGGRNPIPNALVYVPNGEVASLVDGVACDTCDSLVSGSPIAWAKTDDTGHFALSNVPSDTSFSLVVQLGRWRRQFTVADALPAGQTRWVEHVTDSPGQLVLTTDANEPVPYPDPSGRLRLPATQRRCSSLSCGGEGDIPKTAVLLGDGDPVQCTLRKIGLSDAEFTPVGGHGRLHIYPANGMRVNSTVPAYGDGGVTGMLIGSVPALDGYSLLMAPCNAAHSNRHLSDYGASVYGSGPSYNSWPDPTLTEPERANVKWFVDAGGRLITTHWMAMDVVHLNYNPPARARFGTYGIPVALESPFDPSSDPRFASALSDYVASSSGFGWRYVDATELGQSAPAFFLFGGNVGASGNVLDARPSWAAGGRFPSATYTIDTSSGAVGRSFAAWAAAVGASAAGGEPLLSWQDWSPMVQSVQAGNGVVSLLVGDSRQPAFFAADPSTTLTTPIAEQPCLHDGEGGYACEQGATWGAAHVGMFQFDTPLDAADKCGRVAVASGHVSRPACYTPSNTRNGEKYCDRVPSDGGPLPDCDCLTFPEDASTACGAATTAMSPEELSFEYLLFSSTQCIGEFTPPPPPANLSKNLFTRDFEANCDSSELPVWRLFSWQAVVPDGTSIEFFGATADTQDELDSAEFVSIGGAFSTTVTWTAAEQTVDDFFRQKEEPDVSRKWLRILAVLTPNRGASPTLSEWRVVFDCVPSE
jgi:hypothetical protein